jgi:hypothetical protein
LESKLTSALNEIKVLQTALMGERDKKQPHIVEDQKAVLAKKEEIPKSKLTIKTETTVLKKTAAVTQDSPSEVWNEIVKKLKQFNGT